MWNGDSIKSDLVDTLALFPPQQQLLETGFADSTDDTVICSPTGSGKTLMGEWAMRRALRNGLKCAYIAPLKAIVHEKSLEWSLRFPGTKVGTFFGETNRA